MTKNKPKKGLLVVVSETKLRCVLGQQSPNVTRLNGMKLLDVNFKDCLDIPKIIPRSTPIYNPDLPVIQYIVKLYTR